MGLAILSREATVKIVALPSEETSALKGKNLLPLESRPLFRRDLLCRKANRKSQMSLLSKMTENEPEYPFS